MVAGILGGATAAVPVSSDAYFFLQFSNIADLIGDHFLF